MRRIFRDILITLILVVVVFLLLQFTFQRFVIVEHCMEPGLHEGERILVNKVVYHLHEPERGDVIIFHPPFDPELVYIKRIIAIPGDTVEVRDGAVYVNGTELDEPYIMEPPNYTFPLTGIAVDEYFVLGDNRNNANDSHKGWTVPKENIIGKARLIFWPPKEWGMVHHYPLAEQLAGSTE
jgi:signal peptidase I